MDKSCELGRFVPQNDGTEAVEFPDLTGLPVTVRAGARTVTIEPRYGGPVRLTSDQVRALAAVLARWSVRRTLAVTPEERAQRGY